MAQKDENNYPAYTGEAQLRLVLFQLYYNNVEEDFQKRWVQETDPLFNVESFKRAIKVLDVLEFTLICGKLSEERDPKKAKAKAFRLRVQILLLRKFSSEQYFTYQELAKTAGTDPYLTSCIGYLMRQDRQKISQPKKWYTLRAHELQLIITTLEQKFKTARTNTVWYHSDFLHLLTAILWSQHIYMDHPPFYSLDYTQTIVSKWIELFPEDPYALAFSFTIRFAQALLEKNENSRKTILETVNKELKDCAALCKKHKYSKGSDKFYLGGGKGIGMVCPAEARFHYTSKEPLKFLTTKGEILKVPEMFLCHDIFRPCLESWSKLVEQ